MNPFLEPLAASILLPAAADHPLVFGIDEVLAASEGVRIWKSVLLKGRLPSSKDFRRTVVATKDDPQPKTNNDVEGITDLNIVWPPEPLFSSLCSTLVELDLARFVLRHPEAAGAACLSVLRSAVDFALRSTPEEDEEEYDEYLVGDENDADGYEYNDTDDPSDAMFYTPEPLLAEDLELLASDIAKELSSEWSGAIGGVRSLDRLFGSNHGLFDVSPNDPSGSGGGGGFGLHDGVWCHSGWSILPPLQRRVSDMIELRTLVKELGRRPTAEGATSLRRFNPREENDRGVLAATDDPAARTSVSGLALSSSLSEMLPSEAVLLKGSSALRRLFMAKRVESKLLSYRMSGWADVPSIPRRRWRYKPRMPSAPGGSVVICLDTSHSMSGAREDLSKAVVLAAVGMAHQQKRDCRVVAFSNSNGVMECDKITADKDGILCLLKFLENSFGGGTDVTGALKHAMLMLGEEGMESSDLLLVTDGEIPDPPVPPNLMKELEELKQLTGMEVHGLLVGKRDSAPLESICTKVHNFLGKYDGLGAFGLIP